MLYLAPYKMGSQGCKNLADTLGIKRIRPEKSKFKGRPNRTVINWGRATLSDEVLKCRVLNNPEAVNAAGNKLLSFKGFSKDENINIPEFTEDKDVAKDWLRAETPVVCRTVLRGHSGAGIVIAETEEELVDAPLYVKYVKKTQEYRIHVFQGKAFDVQRKMRRKDVEDENVNWKVRNHDNGFIFGREGVDVPEEGQQQAILAVAALGLDFGAVDLIYNKQEDKYLVIEVNTAPGLTGTTLENYSKVFADAKF